MIHPLRSTLLSTCTRLSTSSCWSAKSWRAHTRFSHAPCGVAWAEKPSPRCGPCCPAQSRLWSSSSSQLYASPVSCTGRLSPRTSCTVSSRAWWKPTSGKPRPSAAQCSVADRPPTSPRGGTPVSSPSSTLFVVLHHNRRDVVELEAFFPALPVTHEPGLMPSSRIAYRTWNEAQLLLALVSVHLHVRSVGTIRIPAFPLIPSVPLALWFLSETLWPKCLVSPSHSLHWIRQ